ncbi:transposase [Cryobacterium sp. CAN_C3]|uniref:IS110 family transposase n=1 Tax=unclassified Cryobacterium TaxID=2649013 RepID=UPI001A2758FB|nr:transposase [Cryobacterium sp. CAN_C3]
MRGPLKAEQFKTRQRYRVPGIVLPSRRTGATSKPYSPKSLPGPQTVAYEAGPTGFGLARLFVGAGIDCLVAAPSKLQRPTGDRVKTDARDAFQLARLLHVGDITVVHIPTVEEEAARDLVRSREDTRQDLMSARHRMSKLLLRHGFVYSDGAAWTGKHDRWLRSHRTGDLAFEMAFDASYEAVVQTVARRDRLDRAIELMAADSQFTPMVNRLGCLRGIAPLTGFALAVEITDWHRFTGQTIGSFLGLVPSEYSSGQTRQLGGITKTGNSHARRLLVEAAWHHRRDYRPTARSVLQERWEKAPEDVRLRGQAGNERLHKQWIRFDVRKKRPVIANVAIARELAGWCWSVATMDK